MVTNKRTIAKIHKNTHTHNADTVSKLSKQQVHKFLEIYKHKHTHTKSCFSNLMLKNASIYEKERKKEQRCGCCFFLCLLSSPPIFVLFFFYLRINKTPEGQEDSKYSFTFLPFIFQPMRKPFRLVKGIKACAKPFFGAAIKLLFLCTLGY